MTTFAAPPGQMVKSVDPSTVPLLREELVCPLRAKRLRGIEMAVYLELVDQVFEELIELLQDEDLIVRLEAIAALSRATSPMTDRVLADVANDPNPRVREAAKRCLDERRLVSQWQEIWDSPNH